MKTKITAKLGEKLCEYCSLDEDKRGIHNGPNGPIFMCEMYGCEEAYKNYLEEQNN